MEPLDSNIRKVSGRYDLSKLYLCLNISDVMFSFMIKGTVFSAVSRIFSLLLYI